MIRLVLSPAVLSLALALALANGNSVLAAQTVYRSVGADGSVIFSDTPPATNATAVETLQLEVAAESANPADQSRIHAMRETTDRMVADRLTREKHRAELRQLRAQTNALEQSGPYTYYAPQEPRYGNVYPYGQARPWLQRQRTSNRVRVLPPPRRLSLSEQLSARTRAPRKDFGDTPRKR